MSTNNGSRPPAHPLPPGSNSASATHPRVGLLTYHRSVNDGSVMQAFCLYNILKREVPSASVEIIDYMPRSLRRRHARIVFAAKHSLIDTQFLWTSWNQMRFLRQHCSFSRRQLISDDLGEAQEFIDSLQYDIVVVGSDAAWELNGVSPPPPNVYYEPSHSVPVVAFAVSADPVPTLQSPLFEPRKDLGNALSQFKVITVRDEATRQFVISVGVNPNVVGILPDPTLLWDFGIHIEPVSRLGSGRRPVAGLAVSSAISRPLRLQLADAGFEVVDIMAPPREANSLPRYLTIQGRLGIYFGVDAMFTDRFHMAIFALKSGRGPVVFLEDASRWPLENSKGRDLLYRLGLDEFVYRVERDYVPEGLVQRAISSWQVVSSTLARSMSQLRNHAETMDLPRISRVLRSACHAHVS
jgi:hypothetical protein